MNKDLKKILEDIPKTDKSLVIDVYQTAKSHMYASRMFNKQLWECESYIGMVSKHYALEQTKDYITTNYEAIE